MAAQIVTIRIREIYDPSQYTIHSGDTLNMEMWSGSPGLFFKHFEYALRSPTPPHEPIEYIDAVHMDYVSGALSTVDMSEAARWQFDSSVLWAIYEGGRHVPRTSEPWYYSDDRPVVVGSFATSWGASAPDFADSSVITVDFENPDFIVFNNTTGESQSLASYTYQGDVEEAPDSNGRYSHQWAPLTFFAPSDILAGTAENDRLFAKAGTLFVDGGDGNDVIRGGASAVALLGGSGKDRITAGSATETIAAGDGNDIVAIGSETKTAIGGNGFDSLFFYAVGEAVQVDITNGSWDQVDGYDRWGANYQRFTSFEKVTGTKFDDVFTGAAGSKVKYLNGGGGDDLFHISGTYTSVNVWGGAGADVFKFFAGGYYGRRPAHATLRDFNSADGDKIDLSSVSDWRGKTFQDLEITRLYGEKSAHHDRGALVSIEGTNGRSSATFAVYNATWDDDNMSSLTADDFLFA